jgi:hypothetical protein
MSPPSSALKGNQARKRGGGGKMHNEKYWIKYKRRNMLANPRHFCHLGGMQEHGLLRLEGHEFDSL